MLFSLLLVTVNRPQFINEFAKTRVMAEMEHYFIPSADENSFINQPITVALSRPPHAQTHSVVVLCSCVLWLIILLQTDPQDFVVPHIVCVRVLNGRKDELKAALTAAGIPVGVHYKPNHLLSLFRPAPGSLPLPVTEQLYGELVTLPMHPGLSAADVEHICDVITATLA